MAAVFVGLRLSALGCWHWVVQFDFEDLLPDCWGDQGSCQLALRTTSCSWTYYIVCEAFLIELLANILVWIWERNFSWLMVCWHRCAHLWHHILSVMSQQCFLTLWTRHAYIYAWSLLSVSANGLFIYLRCIRAPTRTKERSLALFGVNPLLFSGNCRGTPFHHYPGKAGRGGATLWPIVIWPRAGPYLADRTSKMEPGRSAKVRSGSIYCASWTAMDLAWIQHP